jgi:DNA-damage-inducible protein D
MENLNLALFEGITIRKIWHNNEWYFSIVDVIGILTETDRPRKYWSDLKKKLLIEGFNETSEKIGQLKITASDGKNRLTDCANTSGIFRIVMSIPSPKAEPLKLWLAQTGKQAIEEAENPELAIERAAELYKAKGYSNEWVAQRLKTIEVRKELTDEWKQRGVKDGQEYSVLTATIAKAAFGLTPSEHKDVKGLAQQNLRDHMTSLELIFTALSEEVTRQVAIRDDAQGFVENHDAAQYGGNMAGDARRKLEKDKGIKVVSSDNFLGLKGEDTDNEKLKE